MTIIFIFINFVLDLETTLLHTFYKKSTKFLPHIFILKTNILHFLKNLLYFPLIFSHFISHQSVELLFFLLPLLTSLTTNSTIFIFIIIAISSPCIFFMAFLTYIPLCSSAVAVIGLKCDLSPHK